MFNYPPAQPQRATSTCTRERILYPPSPPLCRTPLKHKPYLLPPPPPSMRARMSSRPALPSPSSLFFFMDLSSHGQRHHHGALAVCDNTQIAILSRHITDHKLLPIQSFGTRLKTCAPFNSSSAVRSPTTTATSTWIWIYITPIPMAPWHSRRLAAIHSTRIQPPRARASCAPRCIPSLAHLSALPSSWYTMRREQPMTSMARIHRHSLINCGRFPKPLAYYGPRAPHGFIATIFSQTDV